MCVFVNEILTPLEERCAICDKSLSGWAYDTCRKLPTLDKTAYPLVDSRKSFNPKPFCRVSSAVNSAKRFVLLNADGALIGFADRVQKQEDN